MITSLHDPMYPSDPGTGVTLARDEGDAVRIGVYWDGSERMVVHVPIGMVAAMLVGPVDAEPTSEWQLPHAERVYG